MLKICLLGCGGTMPLPNRFLTSMLASYNGRMMLIDCGEGTQVSMKLVGWGFKAIDVICFTHYHADHVVGITGLLLTIANSGRTEPLTIIGPIGLQFVLKGLTVIAQGLPYEIQLIEVEEDKDGTYKVGEFLINTIPVDHGIPCLAYSLQIERNRRFNKEKAEGHKIPKVLWSKLQRGEEVLIEGKLLTPDMVLGDNRKGIKVSYCTDTRPVKDIVSLISGSDLFICEGMYGDDSEIEKAEKNKHMLFSEAAKLANDGNVKEMWLTHYSPSLNEPELHLENATLIFANTLLGKDRMIKEVLFEK